MPFELKSKKSSIGNLLKPTVVQIFKFLWTKNSLDIMTDTLPMPKQ